MLQRHSAAVVCARRKVHVQGQEGMWPVVVQARPYQINLLSMFRACLVVPFSLSPAPVFVFCFLFFVRP
jgi:hypothetical protein